MITKKPKLITWIEFGKLTDREKITVRKRVVKAVTEGYLVKKED